VDLAERTGRVVAEHLPAFGADRITRVAAAAAGLGGDLRRQVIALLPAGEGGGTVLGAGPLVTELPAAGVTAGPRVVAALEPIRSVPEVVAAVGALMRQAERDPVLIEQVLDGLTRFAHSDRAGLAAALAPKVPQYEDPMAGLLRAVAGGTWTPWTPNHFAFRPRPGRAETGRGRGRAGTGPGPGRGQGRDGARAGAGPGPGRGRLVARAAGFRVDAESLVPDRTIRGKREERQWTARSFFSNPTAWVRTGSRPWRPPSPPRASRSPAGTRCH
jgi:hypothetical protein